MFIGGAIILAAGLMSLLGALLLRRGNVTATKWMGPSVQGHTYRGLAYALWGIITLGHGMVPDNFAEAYSRFMLASSFVFVGLLVFSVRSDRRNRNPPSL